MRYEVIDQQWVKDEEEAERIRDRLLRAAASRNLVVGIAPSGSGFMITVEREVDV